MIDSYAKYSKGGLVAEVNWNKAVTPGKFLRFKVGGKSVVVPREDLFMMVLLYGTADEGAMVTKVKRWDMETVNRLKRITLKRDMKKGEMVQMPITYFVPRELAESVDNGGTSGIPVLDKQIIERRSVNAVQIPSEAYPHNFGETK